MEETTDTNDIGIDKNALIRSIFLAEGGSATNYPYGILKKFKTTTPFQATLNTINTALKTWDGEGDENDFIQHLGNKYAPVGADNDPKGLNKNWVSNVQNLYSEQVKMGSDREATF